MFAKSSAALLFALLVAGCSDKPMPVSDDAPLDPAEPIPQLRTFTLNASLTTFGSGHVAGTYIHPTPPEPLAMDNHNCVAVEISGAGIRHLNATAQWAGGERLALFQRMKDQTGPARDLNYTVGMSPLHYDIDYPTGDKAQWTFVGVAPDPGMPAAFGIDADQTVSLHVRIDYVDESEPKLEADAFQGCSIQTS